MTTKQLIKEAKARGFRFVGTLTKRIPLDEFTPYGEGSTPTFTWRSWTQASDMPRKCLAGLCGGIWTFYVTEGDFY